MVAAVIAAVGIAGATGVWFSAKAIRRTDQAAVREWEARANPILERAEALHRELRVVGETASGGEARVAGLAALRRAFDAVRAGIDDLPRAPDVLMPAVTEYRNAVTEMGEALAALDRLAGGDSTAHADLTAAISRAERRLREGDAKRKRLRARLRLEDDRGLSPTSSTE